MSWQEELRRLDAELASGKISLHDHRRQREELLAAASGGFAPSPVVSPLAQMRREPAWPSAHPETGPAPAHPAAASQQTTATPEQHASGSSAPPEPTVDAPQPVPGPAPQAEPAAAAQTSSPAQSGAPKRSHSAALLATDRPTTAPSPADERPTDSIRYPPVHNAPTIITEPVPPGGLPGLLPLRHHDDGPNPPVAPDEEHSTGGKPTWLFLALGVLIVLALIIGGVWYVGSRSTNVATAPAAPSSVAASTVPTTPAVEDRVPALPGTPDVNNSTVSIDKGLELGLYPAQAAEVYKRNGVSEIVYRASSQGEERYFLLVIHAADQSKANAVADYMRTGALNSGFKPLAADQTVLSGTQSGRAMNGTWYASGDEAIVLWVSQPNATKNTTQLKQHLYQVRSALEAVLPVN